MPYIVFEKYLMWPFYSSNNLGWFACFRIQFLPDHIMIHSCLVCVCLCVCVHACVRACVHAWVCVCVLCVCMCCVWRRCCQRQLCQDHRRWSWMVLATPHFSFKGAVYVTYCCSDRHEYGRSASVHVGGHGAIGD